MTAAALTMGGVGLVRRRRRVVLAVALIGCAVCGVTGGLPSMLGALAAIGLVSGRARHRTWGPAGLTVWRVGNVAALFLAVVAGAVGGSMLVVGVALVCWLQVHRAWTGEAASDDRIAVLLALLQGLLGCILTISSWLAPLFAALAALAPLALLLCHLGEVAEGRPHRLDALPVGRRLGALATVGPVSLVVTVALFFGIPRLDPTQLLGGRGAADLAGFDEEIDLGDLGEIKDNPDIALRMRAWDATGNELTGPFYLRGTALDRYEDDRWWSTAPVTGRVALPRGLRTAGATDIRQEVLLQPFLESVLFGIPTMVEVRGGVSSADLAAGEGVFGVQRDANGTWRHAGAPGRVAYTVRSVPVLREPSLMRDEAPDPAATLWSARERDGAAAGIWTALPPDLDPRVAVLTAEVLADPANRASVPGSEGLAVEALTPYDQAAILESWLRREYEYTLVPEPGQGGQALTTFLFESRRGHCEYFATALAVMLRTRGVPARLVNGFHAHEWNAFAEYLVVRQSDAHSWVEAHLGRAGWVGFDATPTAAGPGGTTGWLRQVVDWWSASWQTAVLEYDLGTQIGLARGLGRGLRPPRPTAEFPGLGGLLGWLPLFLSGLVVVGLGFGLRVGLGWLAGERAGRRRAAGRVEATWRRARALVIRRGWRIPPSLPPVAAADWLEEQAGPYAEPLRELAWRHYRVRYGADLDEDHAGPAREALAALRRLPRARRRAT